MDASANSNPQAPNGPNDPLIVNDEPLPKKQELMRISPLKSHLMSGSILLGHKIVKSQNANIVRSNTMLQGGMVKCKKILGVIDTSQTTLSFQAKKLVVLRESLVMSLLLLNFLLREFIWHLRG